MVLAVHQVEQHLYAVGEKRRGLQNADDRDRHPIECHSTADDRRVAAEVTHPVFVRKHSDSLCSATIIRRQRHSAEDRRESHHLEEVSGDQTDVDSDGSTLRLLHHGPRRVLRDTGERRNARAKIANLRHREREIRLPRSTRRVPEIDQSVTVAIWERLQEDATNDAENRRVGTDAERQREYDDGGESRAVSERAKRESHVGRELLEP